MHVFSGKVEIPAGTPLGGYGREEGSRGDAELEVHGIGLGCPSGGEAVEFCSIDALYAGDLARGSMPDSPRRVLAATHTHAAPMLDGGKLALGPLAAEAVARYRVALDVAPRIPVDPDHCTVYRGEVGLPVYRRFDHPDTPLNRVLAGRAGLFPNPAQPLDRGVRILVFGRGEETHFAIVHHACHPVTRHDLQRVSPDYVGAIRAAVAARFGTLHCLFFLGCAGDVRPDFAGPRVAWLPRSRVNWRFRWPPTKQDEARADEAYREAVASARKLERIPLGVGAISWRERRMEVEGLGPVAVPELQVGDGLAFAFLPFEVSHRYHLDLQAAGDPTLLVSCAGDTRGYLPHPSQLRSGGYEVDGSRAAMGLPDRVSWRGSFT